MIPTWPLKSMLQGVIDMDGNLVSGLPAPVGANDAVRKAYVDAIPGGYDQGARVYSDAPQDLPNDTTVIIAFNQENYDTDGIHDNAVNNSRLTCQTVGKYLIVGNIRISSNATALRALSIKLNNTSYWGQLAIQAVNGTVTVPNVTTVIDMGVGDYVELAAYQTSGVGLTSDVDPDYAPSFMMQRIG